MESLRKAFAKLRVERWSEAEVLFIQELKDHPWNPELHFGLGVAIEKQGDLRGALKHYKQAHRGRPERHDFQVVLARIHQALGELSEALVFWVELARSEIHGLEAYLRMAEICVALGQTVDAELALRQVIQLRPNEDSAWLTLAQIQLGAGRDEEARESLSRLLKLRPDLHQVHNELGRVHMRAGRLDAAEICFRQALALHPDYVLGMNNLASLMQRNRRSEEALELYEKAIRIQPDGIPALHFNHAYCLSELGRVVEARALFAKLLQDAPSEPRYLWADLATVRVVLDEEAQVSEEKSRFEAGLARMEKALDSAEESALPDFFDPVLPSFHLHYQVDELRALQTRYGKLVQRVGKGLQTEIPEQLPRQGEKIRVGFVSAYFQRHTVNKLFSGWVRGLDPAHFEVVVFHLGPGFDLDSRALAEVVELHHLPGQLTQTAHRIARAQLDVLIYPEVGMDADVLRLAGVRLAPLQCMAWGHPVTSGLPTMDLFLSSEAMEPEDAEDHYTEELVRLPGLSVTLREPSDLSDGLDRAGLGLPDDRVLALSCQTLSKYRPEHDWIWVKLAQENSRLMLVFIAHFSSSVSQAFHARLGRAFEAEGMRMEAHLRLLPRMSEGAYRDLNRAADLYLDSLGWSGGNTTIEAIHHGLPVVTTPGVTMRSRHSTALLGHVGLSEHVSDSAEAYIARVRRLVSDADYRAEVRAETLAASHRLWDDSSPIQALEQLLIERVRYHD